MIDTTKRALSKYPDESEYAKVAFAKDINRTWSI